MRKTYQGRIVLPRVDSENWQSRGYFPHYDAKGVKQHIILGLFDALPQRVLRLWAHEMRQLERQEAELERRKRIQAFLDRGYGACFLKNTSAAEIVERALIFLEQQRRWKVYAWCIMPNHVHAVVTFLEGYSLSSCVHSFKSYTATECNKVLERRGPFWQREVYDRYIRNQTHFLNAVEYVEMNPVKAGLCARKEDWRWSSARKAGA